MTILGLLLDVAAKPGALDVPAKDSWIFWTFIGVIVGAILLVALRDLFLWYFRINELYDCVDQLSDQVEKLHQRVEQLSAGGVVAQGSSGPAVGNDAEIAVALALATHFSKK